MENSIVFNINSDEFIKINLLCDLANLFGYDEAIVIYTNIKTDKSFVIEISPFVIDTLKALLYKLNLVLNGKLKLDVSIVQNIGYLWNAKIGYMRDKRNKNPKLGYHISKEGKKYWVGQNYILLETPSNQIPTLTSWLYEKDGTFFFEITPNYPPDYRWNYMKLKDAKQDPNFKTFKEFMQTYQPLVVTTIERSVLEQWLREVEKLIPLIEANDSKYFINQEHSEK